VNDDVANKSSVTVQKPVTVADFYSIAEKLHQILGLQTIRLTGGEPTLYKEIVPLIKALKNIKIPIKLTTNGFLLQNLIEKIDYDELHSINVSLDALDEDIFFQISKRRSMHKIVAGIDAAIAKGIEVKLNCVVIRGVNESQILPLMAFANERQITIRFLELMKMGHIFDGSLHQFYAEAEILEKIASRYDLQEIKRTTSATANYWETSEGQIFGIIANESSPFCHDCNRLRLDSFGNIYGCISNSAGINISQYLDNQLVLEQKLKQALAQKQAVKFTGSNMRMLEIGG